MQRRTYYFGGRVQGVGFRYTVKNISQQYDVAGYVRNLPDGRVQLVMEGADKAMDELLQDVQQRMNGYIREVRSERAPATGEFSGFTIRH